LSGGAKCRPVKDTVKNPNTYQTDERVYGIKRIYHTVLYVQFILLRKKTNVLAVEHFLERIHIIKKVKRG